MATLLIALIAAIASPFIWGLMNVIDKFIVSKKVKNTLSFTAVVAIVNIIFGLIFAAFIDWKNIDFSSSTSSIIAGILYGSQFFFYYYILSKKDTSHTIGLMYSYPIILILLSFLFLNEIVSLQGYIGIFLIILGSLLLSLHIKKIGMLKGFYLIIPLIICVATAEFLMKVSTNNIPELNGFAINLVVMGATVLCILFHKKTRKDFPKELKNFKWALLSESFTFIGLLTIYVAMSGISATLVTAIAALQPITVLFFEYVANKMVGNMIKDKNFLRKFISIIIIVIGAVLVYLNDIIKLLN
jgi:drug/metabolite transporter (DMT)-like permease